MKVNFKYSQVYDELFSYMSRNKFGNSQILDLETFTIRLSNHWKQDENKIIREIEKVSGLRFQDNVNCFIVKHLGYRAISDPFTIKASKDFDYLTAVIIHELVHVLLRDNQTILNLINKKFAHEESDFKVHFPVLLIERKVVENLFGEKFFTKIKKKDDHNPDLAYEWNEVNNIYGEFNGNIIKFLEKC